MKKKLFIALYVTCIVIGVVLLNVVVSTVRSSPATQASSEESADIAIGQFTERANSTTTTTESAIPRFLLPFAARAENLQAGCGLRLSFAPTRKAVDSGEIVDYDITFYNQGKDACKNVSLSVYYTDDEKYVSSTPAPTASDYYWSIGDLSSQRSHKINLKTRTSNKNGEDMVSEACATADNAQDVCSQNVIFVEKGASQSSPLAKLTSKITIPSIFGTVWGQKFSSREFGIWVWDSPAQMTDSYAKQVVSISKKNGFNVIYLTIDDYIPITEIRDSKSRQEATDNYMKTLSIFVSAANGAGIQVDAVGGAKDWAIKNNRWKGYALIDFVKTYNEKYPNAKLRGLQYDVEPYLLSDYEIDKRTILKEFVEFVDESTKRMKTVPAKFTIVVPHFYDKDQKWTPSFMYLGEEAHTFTHLLRVLRQKEDTSVILMSYRNYFDAENGTRQISQSEIDEATKGGYKTKVIIAQETGKVSPDYVTYYDYPKVSLFDALTEIQNYFGRDKNFGGVAVHYFDSFLKME